MGCSLLFIGRRERLDLLRPSQLPGYSLETRCQPAVSPPYAIRNPYGNHGSAIEHLIRKADTLISAYFASGLSPLHLPCAAGCP